MATALPIIATEAELLKTLAAAPYQRGVVALEGGQRCVADLTPAADGVVHVVAQIAGEAEAAALLVRAYQADLAGDVVDWSALPLRYGPACSMWLLADHPAAPAHPGA